ncbi:MAG TPA: hypothetical protein VGL08_10585 [Paraburkholderia sp.]|jgi:hypothetical protein
MTTPISGSSGTGLLDALLHSGSSGSAGRAKSSQPDALSDAGMLASQTLAAALQAAASMGQLALSFGQALENSTTVDPSSGQCEISASASSQLSAALNGLLVQSGFSQQQAAAATSDFTAQLAHGGPIDLSANFDATSAIASSISASYGSQTMSASSVAVNERAGSVAVEFDPGTGKLSISLKEQQISTVASVTEISGPGAAQVPPPSEILKLLLDAGRRSNGEDSKGDGNGAAIGQEVAALSGESPLPAANAPATSATANAPADDAKSPPDANSVLGGLIAGLALPTLHGMQDTPALLSRMAKAAQPDSAAASDGTDDAQGPSDAAPASVTIGFTQTLSISLLDLNGHGTTLFKRTDGSTGSMTFEPTHVEA